MTEMTLHIGRCHCGRVRFEAHAPAHPDIMDCNCSMCSRSGYLHMIVPKACFRLLSGQESLTTYQFNTGSAKHLFCAACGIKSFYVPRSHPDSFSVNVRCLDPGTVTGMNIEKIDGRNWEQTFASRRG